MYFSKKERERVPKYTCRSCTKCVNSRCTFYNRMVDVDYNKCFNHTFYHTISTQYKSPENIKEIAKENYLKEIA